MNYGHTGLEVNLFTPLFSNRRCVSALSDNSLRSERRVTVSNSQDRCRSCGPTVRTSAGGGFCSLEKIQALKESPLSKQTALKASLSQREAVLPVSNALFLWLVVRLCNCVQIQFCLCPSALPAEMKSGCKGTKVVLSFELAISLAVPGYFKRLWVPCWSKSEHLCGIYCPPTVLFSSRVKVVFL